MATQLSTPDIETVACPLCATDNAQETGYRQGPFRVVRCGDCRHWYLSPRPTGESAAAFYRGDSYFAGGGTGYHDYSEQEQSLRRTFRRLLRNLSQRQATGGRLLELGAGLGYFLDEARPYFAQRCGVELSPIAAEQAARLADAPVLHELEAIEDEARFDCIIALHVIEHIPDPLPFVRKLGAMLAPGGMLVLAAPHMGSVWRHLMGRHWPSFKYPEHLSFFDSVTLKRLLIDAGFLMPTRLPYLHDFPLSEILAKLHLAAPAIARHILVPLPATTVCYAARRQMMPPR